MTVGRARGWLLVVPALAAVSSLLGHASNGGSRANELLQSACLRLCRRAPCDTGRVPAQWQRHLQATLPPEYPAGAPPAGWLRLAGACCGADVLPDVLRPPHAHQPLPPPPPLTLLQLGYSCVSYLSTKAWT